MNWTVKTLHTSEPDFALWKNYYSRLEQKGIYHSPEYIRCLEKHYQDEAELFVFGNEKEYLYYPYFRRRLDKLPFSENCAINLSDHFDIISSWYYGGPLPSNSRLNKLIFKEFIQVFSDFSRQERFVSEFIRFDPYLQNHSNFTELLPVSKNRESIYVDLRLPEDRIWVNMEGRARTAIRKAKKLGVKVYVSDDINDVTHFYKIYNAEMERKMAPGHYLFSQEFIMDLFKTLGSKIALICAIIDDVIISGGVFVCEAGEAAHYYLMATDQNYIRYQANNLILHEAIRYFKKKKLKIFDFQGGREGVYKFKKSFSKNRISFFTCGIIHNLPITKKLVDYKNAHSSGLKDAFFPEYRIKNTN
ncbi:GNAT family N-acetyltransferase [Thermodesulfobacteriota bacterium]